MDTKDDFIKAIKFMTIDKIKENIEKLKKKILIFDIDGVLLNSSHNMYLSWTRFKISIL